EVGRAVLDRFAPVLGMERHPHSGLKIVDRHPPVQLTSGGGVPRVSMRMVSIGNTGGQVLGRICHSKPRNILEGSLGIAAQFKKQSAQARTRLWMMNETLLQAG